MEHATTNQAELIESTARAEQLTSETDRGNSASESSSAHISSEADLIAFTRLPLEERVLTAQLRGVLAESALTGRIRYKWPLLRPLVDFVLEQVLTAYDAETRVEVGPPGPDSVSETVERFQKLLSAFSDAPWTFQRLCEILLEPKRQYSRLPKLVLAIEKCLLVTTEQPPTDPEQLPPPPLCSALGAVNINPPSVYTNAHHGTHAAGPSGGPDDSAAFTHSLLDLRHHPHHHYAGNHVGAPEHIEEDHWPEGLPEGKGGFKAAGVVGVGLHGPLRAGSPGHAPGTSSGGTAGHGMGLAGGISGPGGSPGHGGAAHQYTGAGSVVVPAAGPHALLGQHALVGVGGVSVSGGGGVLSDTAGCQAAPRGDAEPSSGSVADGSSSAGEADMMAVDSGPGAGAVPAADTAGGDLDDGSLTSIKPNGPEDARQTAAAGPDAGELAVEAAAQTDSGKSPIEVLPPTGTTADVEMEAVREGPENKAAEQSGSSACVQGGEDAARSVVPSGAEEQEGAVAAKVEEEGAAADAPAATPPPGG